MRQRMSSILWVCLNRDVQGEGMVGILDGPDGGGAFTIPLPSPMGSVAQSRIFRIPVLNRNDGFGVWWSAQRRTAKRNIFEILIQDRVEYNDWRCVRNRLEPWRLS